MAGWTSEDDFLNEITVNGKFRRSDWNKLTHAVGVQAAGTWYALAHALGNPGAVPLGVNGTNLAWHAAHDRLAGAMPHGGDVLPDYKSLLNAAALSAAVTTMPAVFMLVDLLGWYPVSTTTVTGDQALVNSRTFTATAATPTVITNAAGWDIQEYTAVQLTNSGGALPAGLSAGVTYYWHRLSATTGNLATSPANIDSATYVAASGTGTGTHTITMTLTDRCPSNGAGVQAFITPSVALGVGTPNIRLTYTDSDGNAGNLTPSTLPQSAASAPIGQIEYSGTGAGKYGPFMPLAAGDKGMRSVEQFNYSATHTSGTTNVCLCRPIATLPMTTVGVAAEREFKNQIPSLPRIFDNACLVWLMYAGAATPVSSGFFGHADFGWG